ncbi:MAG: colicin E3/pyocin S6 family cytotoxin [Bacteroidota bacterium]|nr:colicin E3/pyocin S6 family cytotoxin [Bacteroidota bacterium]
MAKTNGGGNKIGPAIVLKVMAGDQFNLRVSSWYKKNGVTPGTPNNPLTDLINALNGNIGGIAGNHGTSADLIANNTLNPGAISFYATHNSADSTTKPKAFINWVLFDEQFNYVAANSGFEQVGADNTLTVHTRTGQPINKNGYLYIYTSNETPNIDVFFDNLQVTHIRGPLLEETHYYPFGLTMAGISSKALAFGQPENKKKYQNYEFNSDFDINLYESFYRNHDPQLGRFWQIDPKIEQGMENWSPYVAMFDNPIKFNDFLGDTPGDTVTTYHPLPKEYRKSLPGFAKSQRLKHRQGARPSWNLGKGWHAEWDFQHGEVEVYDKSKQHQGAFDPKTGVKLKDAVKGRRPTYQSVAMDRLKASAPDLELKVMTPEEVMKTTSSTTATTESPEAAEAARKDAISQEAGRNPWAWSSGYPSPPGVISPPYGTQGSPAVAKAAACIAGWVLVIATDGAAAPVLKPILLPL